MRLTPEEINHLTEALSLFIEKNEVELRLFGSRANSHQKGGDIDLLLMVNSQKIKDKLNLKKHLILAYMKELIGDQRIDLKIAEVNEINADPFLQIIYPSSILLRKLKEGPSQE